MPEDKKKNGNGSESVLEVVVPDWIIQDLKVMEQNTKKPLKDLVKTSLMMFIATHNDYLGIKPSSK